MGKEKAKVVGHFVRNFLNFTYLVEKNILADGEKYLG
jgi:hypothetical protein